MSKSIIYNIDYLTYLKLISGIENKFNNYKSLLLNHNIYLEHPSVASFLEVKNSNVIKNLFPKESKKFDSASNFYNCLILINYHLGSFLQINDILDSKSIQSISITLEDILIIESFKGL